MEYKIVSVTEKSNGKTEQSYSEQHYSYYVNGINVENPTNPKVREILEISKRVLATLGLKRLEIVAEVEG